MKRLMVALVAAACAAASYAETQWLDWFKLDKTNAESATWVGDGDVTVEGDKFIVDTDASTGMTHTPTAATVSEKGRQFTFSFSAEAPFDFSKLTIPADAKGGVSIAKNGSEALAFFVIGYESDALTWQEFTAAGTPTLDTDYTAEVTVDGTTVTYAIGGQTKVCMLPSSETAPAAFTVLGTGSFTEIDGQQAQKVVASIGTTYYATFADAYAAAANGDTIKLLENVESAVAPAQKTVAIDVNGKTFTLSKSVDENKVLRCVYANGQIVTQLDFDKVANDAYQIKDENDLKKLQKAVAAGTAGTNVFKQTADITLTAVWGGIGAADAKDNVSYDANAKSDTRNFDVYKAGAFKGTYDGGNFTIRGVTIKGGDYNGFFNSASEAVIKNLKISIANGGISGDASSTCALFVGCDYKSTLQNLEAVVDGANDTFDNSTGKDAAIFVGYAVGTTVDGCTNHLNVTACSVDNRKVAGIVLITQKGNPEVQSTGLATTIRNCVNYGDITSLKCAAPGIAGILANQGDGITAKIVSCENYGALSSADSYVTDKQETKYKALGQFIGSGTVTVDGTNKGATTQQAANTAINGLNFATVDGEVATFVKNEVVAQGGSYKVMVKTPPAIALEAGKTLELDKAATVNSADNAYWIDVSAAPTYVSTAKTDYSTAAIEPFAEATWSETLAFPAVVVKVGGETVPAEAYDYAWSPAEIAAMKVGDPDTNYTCTVTIKDTGKVILPGANPTAVWTVKAPAAPAGVTITVVRSTGIADVEKDGESIFEGEEAEKQLVLESGATSVSLTLIADSSIAIPVYKMSKAEIGAGSASKSGSYAIADGDTLTFTAIAADVSGGVTDTEAQAAIKEVVTSDAAKAKVDAVVGAGVNAKTLATWVGKQDNKTAALEGDYVKASVELDVAPITEGTEVKLVDVDMADVSAMTFKVEVGTDDVSAKNAVLSMVKAGTDVEFKTTFNPSAKIVGEEGEKTVQVNIGGKDAAFLKVEIPADAK